MGKSLTQFKIAMPLTLKEGLALEAAKNMRSLTKEIIFILAARLEEAQAVQPDLSGGPKDASVAPLGMEASKSGTEEDG